MTGELIGAAALIVAAVLSFLGVRASSRANARTAEAQNTLHAAAQKAEAEVSAGQLALDLATKLQGRLDTMDGKVASLEGELEDERTLHDEVRTAWRKHEAWDDLLLAKLEEHVPGATQGLPPRPVLPTRRRLGRRPRE